MNDAGIQEIDTWGEIASMYTALSKSDLSIFAQANAAYNTHCSDLTENKLYGVVLICDIMMGDHETRTHG